MDNLTLLLCFTIILISVGLLLKFFIGLEIKSLTQTIENFSRDSRSDFIKLLSENNRNFDNIADELKHLNTQLVFKLDQVVDKIIQFNNLSRADLGEIREQIRNDLKEYREDTVNVVTGNIDQLKLNTKEIEGAKLTLEQGISGIRETLSLKISSLVESNNEALDKMRITVDEKLHGTLEKRVGESFRQVSDRLAQVHQGLGEMQNLAVGVGDLKRALTNVKIRGGWGEVQLESLLSELLSPHQYQKNLRVKETSQECVDFGICLPHSTDMSPVWLPIDAKFPLEDYIRLMDFETLSSDRNELLKSFENTLKGFAKDILILLILLILQFYFCRQKVYFVRLQETNF
jgi:DNA recombination protein RmuC